MRRRPLSSFAIVALVIVLAGVIALASHGTPVWTLLREGRADRLDILAGVAVLWALGGIVAVGSGLAIHRLVRGRDPAAPSLATTLKRAIPATTAVLAVVSLMAIARADLGPATAGEPRRGHVPEESDRRARPLSIDWLGLPVLAGDGSRENARPGNGDGDGGVDFPRGLLLAAAIGLGVAAVVAWLRRRDAAAALDEDEADARRQAMHGTFVSTIDAMLADPDPSTAIRGAYARLLEGLAACGTARLDHEAPMEHLRRVLGVLDVRPAPLRELIELFAVARFSTHDLDTSHRERALGALRTVAADLEATPAFRHQPAGQGAPGALDRRVHHGATPA